MRRSVFSALVMVLAACGIADGAPVVWELADGGNGHAYDLVLDTQPWPEAKIAAASLPLPSGFGPGHLLTVSNAAENEFVRANLTSLVVLGVDGAWAGMTDEVVDGEWRWIDDTPGIWQSDKWFDNPIQTAYVGWTPGSPSSGKEENYLSIRGDGGWNDYSTERHGTPNDFYLVEWEPGSGPCAPII